jgi:outer membrane protein assembly factor BamB
LRLLPAVLIPLSICATAVAGPAVEDGRKSPAPPSVVEVPDLRTRTSGIDWPGFLGPNRDGRSPERGLILPWPIGGPRIVWNRRIGESYAICSTSRGRLFHFDRHVDRARLTCMKSETGEELWRFEYPTRYRDLFGYDGGPRCCPVVDGDRVYLFGAEGMLHALRVVDGALLWKRNTAEEFGVVQNFFGVGSTPVVEGDLLIAQIGGSPPDSPHINTGGVRGLDSGIVAFDKRTGKERYRITDELASYASPVCTTIGGRRWGLVFARGGLVGFEPATGKVDFRFPWRARRLHSVNVSNPVVIGDRVFISESYRIGGVLLKVRPGGYDVLWKDDPERGLSMAAHWNTPIRVEGHLYGCSGRYRAEAELRCVELATGRVTWRVPRLSRTSLLHVDGHFVCLGEDGVLRLLKVDPERYVEVSRVALESPDVGPLLREPAWAAPILSHGLLYVRGRDRLVCLELIAAK